VRRLDLVAPKDGPAPGARIPAVALRVALGLLGAALSLVDYHLSGWLTIGILISVGAAAFPEHLVGWGLILYLGAGQLARPSSLSWQLLVLIAGVHLLHILAMFSFDLPLGSWIEPGVVVRPLRRFLAIQIPTQALAVLALLVLAPRDDGHRPVSVAALAIPGALALVGLALALFRPGTAAGRTRPPRP
jgi:hypothetical protein